jgi:hypothetical protein
MLNLLLLLLLTAACLLQSAADSLGDLLQLALNTGCRTTVRLAMSVMNTALRDHGTLPAEVLL